MYRFGRIRVDSLTVVGESSVWVSDLLAAVAELPSGFILGWLMLKMALVDGAGLDLNLQQYCTHDHLYSKATGAHLRT